MSCMYNSTIPPWMLYPQTQIDPTGKSTWEKAFEIAEKLQKRELKKQLKKEQEEKNKKAPKKFRDFTFFETFAMLTVGSMLFGPWIAHLQLVYLESILR